MLSVLAIVAAVFGIIAVGYVSGRTGYLSEAAARGIADFAFKLAIPALLFHTIVTATFDGVAPLGVIASFFGAAAMVWIAGTLATGLLLRRPAVDQPSLAITATFGNTVMLGLPIGVASLGPDALAPISAIIACHSPLLLLTATLHSAAVLERPGDGDTGRSLPAALVHVARQLASQPIVVALIAAGIWRATGLPLPTPLPAMLETIARAGVPAALVSLGLSLATFKIGGDLPTVGVLLLLKLAAMPLVAAGLATALALPPLSASVVVLMAALPAGANAYLYSAQSGHAVAAASSAVALGTALSAVTLTLVLVLVKGAV
jgi:hypothetical protein